MLLWARRIYRKFPETSTEKLASGGLPERPGAMGSATMGNGVGHHCPCHAHGVDVTGPGWLAGGGVPQMSLRGSKSGTVPSGHNRTPTTRAPAGTLTLASMRSPV